jgi:hypothetical protein
MYTMTKKEALQEAINFLSYISKNEPSKLQDENTLFQEYRDNACFQSWMLDYTDTGEDDGAELKEEEIEKIEKEQFNIFQSALKKVENQEFFLKKQKDLNLINLKFKSEFYL